jgi:hypothetical protein
MYWKKVLVIFPKRFWGRTPLNTPAAGNDNFGIFFFAGPTGNGGDDDGGSQEDEDEDMDDDDDHSD